jgi:hypothetical protein
MILTGTSPLKLRVWPKLALAGVLLVVGCLASPAVAVVACAAAIAGLAAWMVLAGPETFHAE